MLIKLLPVTIAFVLVFSSLSTKALGAAWLLLLFGGLWVFIQNKGSNLKPYLNTLLFTWVLITALALTLKAFPVLYWSDPWAERHGELRLFLGALSIYALARWLPLERKNLIFIAYALCISSAIGLAWVLVNGRGALTTHPIPWAGSMAMVSAMLLALSLKSDFSKVQRIIWFIGGLLAVMAVLSSQSRGAYGIVLWWFCIGSHHLWTLSNVKRPEPHDVSKPLTHRKWFLLGGFLISLGLLNQTPVLERPLHSLQAALHEIRISQESREAGSNSSVGARLYMWQKSLIAIEKSPWIGHGHDKRKQQLLDWAEAAQSEEIKRLGHVHNEYLHQLIDHGLWGLGSQIFYLVGLFIASWQLLQKKHNVAALSVAGMAFIHMTTSITNVNFAHNYYTASLSLFVGLSLWITRLEPQATCSEKTTVQ